MELKPSFYNYSFEVESGFIGVLNTVTEAIAVLSTYEHRSLKTNYHSLSADKIEYLVGNGFLVPYYKNEQKIIHATRIKSVEDPIRAVFRVLTTSDCNARCPYCYETGSTADCMNSRTALQVSRFIIDNADDKPITVQWFGGEPLLNPIAIDDITTMLAESCKRENLEFSIVTNGSLISQDFIHKFRNAWSITDVQISLDGVETEYISRKNYKDPKYTFNRVMKNLHNVIDTGIKTRVRLNYDDENVSSILSLIEILSKQFATKENVYVYAYHLFDKSQGEKKFPDKNTWFLIQRALIDKGLANPLDVFKLRRKNGLCFACSMNGYVIAPNGDLFKCSVSMDKLMKVGTIWDGITDYSLYYEWCDPSLCNTCISCLFLPLCQGGCRAGTMNLCSEACFPQKEFIDDVLRERLCFLQPVAELR